MNCVSPLHRRLFQLLAGCFVVGVGLTGCAGSSGDSEAKTYEEISREDGPNILAETLCSLQQDCNCTSFDLIFSSKAQCVDGYTAQLEQVFGDAEAAGLEFHPECMAEHVNFFNHGIECKLTSELTTEELQNLNLPADCKVWSGTDAEGEGCENHYQALGDSCEQGMQCFNTCTPVIIPTDRKEGERCDGETDLCEPGTLCQLDPVDFEAPPTCVRAPGEGEACVGICDVGLWCDWEGDEICKPPPGEGEPCGPMFNLECAEGLFCDSFGDLCTVTTSPGDPCEEDEECGPTANCDYPEDSNLDERICIGEEPLVCI